MVFLALIPLIRHGLEIITLAILGGLRGLRFIAFDNFHSYNDDGNDVQHHMNNSQEEISFTDS
eukprot:CAMPEP_0170548506 /NCGR_PEP_ID=MMETSP0211-20121228/6818_1 /TAXON_ID=311385 /ORGANISM="Pseudokeronopsis sp., Strain OXSARD2" /LENGTH=62 /DNA_ID=CAMNT_0010854097 /DNA_START=1 /DNA_END=189 /DNA_ORIENTATION=+